MIRGEKIFQITNAVVPLRVSGPVCPSCPELCPLIDAKARHLERQAAISGSDMITKIINICCRLKYLKIAPEIRYDRRALIEGVDQRCPHNLHQLSSHYTWPCFMAIVDGLDLVR